MSYISDDDSSNRNESTIFKTNMGTSWSINTIAPYTTSAVIFDECIKLKKRAKNTLLIQAKISAVTTADQQSAIPDPSPIIVNLYQLFINDILVDSSPVSFLESGLPNANVISLLWYGCVSCRKRIRIRVTVTSSSVDSSGNPANPQTIITTSLLSTNPPSNLNPLGSTQANLLIQVNN